jgi:hypothetical protein
MHVLIQEKARKEDSLDVSDNLKINGEGDEVISDEFGVFERNKEANGQKKM